MKEEKVQPTREKYKGSDMTTLSNYAAVNWTTCKTWINSQKSPETEPGRCRKHEQTNYQY